MIFKFENLDYFIRTGRVKKHFFSPLDFTSSDLREKLGMKTTYDPEFYYLEVENVLLKGGDFSLYFEDLEAALCDDLVFGDRQQKYWSNGTQEFSDELVLGCPVAESGFLVGSNNNYYHWIANYAPRLMFLDKVNFNLPIVIAENRSAFIDHYIESLVGYRKSIVVEHSGFVRFEKLYVPVFFPNPIHSPTGLSFVRSGFRRIYDKDSSLYPAYIYISRDDGGDRRQIVEEEKLIEFLSGYGVQCYTPGKMSLLNQIDLFSSAKLIISPHGAALANLIYTRPGATVVELQSKDCFTRVFWELGKLSGAGRYDILQCSTRENDMRHPNYKDLVVDYNALKAKLDSYKAQGLLD